LTGYRLCSEIAIVILIRVGIAMRKSEKSLLLVSIRKVQLNVLKVWWDELNVMAMHRLAIGHCFTRLCDVVCRPSIHMYNLLAQRACDACFMNIYA